MYRTYQVMQGEPLIGFMRGHLQTIVIYPMVWIAETLLISLSSSHRCSHLFMKTHQMMKKRWILFLKDQCWTIRCRYKQRAQMRPRRSFHRWRGCFTSCQCLLRSRTSSYGFQSCNENCSHPCSPLAILDINSASSFCEIVGPLERVPLIGFKIFCHACKY